MSVHFNYWKLPIVAGYCRWLAYRRPLLSAVRLFTASDGHHSLRRIGSRATLPGAPLGNRTLQGLRVKEVSSPAELEEHSLVWWVLDGIEPPAFKGRLYRPLIAPAILTCRTQIRSPLR